MIRLKSLSFKIAALAVSLSAALIAGEILLRLVRPFTHIYYPAGKAFEAIYQSADDCVYELKPDTQYKHYSYYGDFIATYRINAEGIRSDRIYGLAKPPGKSRVIILGDSFAFGRGVENSQTSAAVLERLLNDGSNPLNRFEVLNLGILGYSLDNEFIYLKRKGLWFDPDCVLLMVFPRNDIMDMRYHEWVRDAEGLPEKIIDRYYAVDTRNHLVNISNGTKNLASSRIKEFIRNHSMLYTFLSEYRYYPRKKWEALESLFKGAPPRSAGSAPARRTFSMEGASPEEKEMVERACLLVQGMSDIAGKWGARFVMVLIPDSIYDDYMLRFARSRNIQVIDINEHMRYDKVTGISLPRDMHWSPFGNDYVARILYNYLKDIL